jgi:hypothetical protein
VLLARLKSLSLSKDGVYPQNDRYWDRKSIRCSPLCIKFASNTLRIFRGRWVNHSKSERLWQPPIYQTVERWTDGWRANQAFMRAGRHTETWKRTALTHKLVNWEPETTRLSSDCGFLGVTAYSLMGGYTCCHSLRSWGPRSGFDLENLWVRKQLGIVANHNHGCRKKGYSLVRAKKNGERRKARNHQMKGLS